MKRITAIITVLLGLLSCQKGDSPTPPQVNKQTVIPCATVQDVRITLRPIRPPHGRASILFIDLDGGVCRGTTWNYTGDIVYSPSGLTEGQVTQLLNRVRLLYDSLNVRITTDSNVFNRAKVEDRQMLIITTTWEWFGQAGGVALINSFGTGDPCWVFSSLLNFNTHYISEASAHELGHTLGLSHQSDYDEFCNMINQYSPGTIMGISYYVTNGWWRNGTCALGCNVIQQDMAQMANIVGYK